MAPRHESRHDYTMKWGSRSEHDWRDQSKWRCARARVQGVQQQPRHTASLRLEGPRGKATYQATGGYRLAVKSCERWRLRASSDSRQVVQCQGSSSGNDDNNNNMGSRGSGRQLHCSVSGSPAAQTSGRSSFRARCVKLARPVDASRATGRTQSTSFPLAHRKQTGAKQHYFLLGRGALFTLLFS